MDRQEKVDRQEMLVVLDGSRAIAGKLPEGAHVIHHFAPRILVVTAPREAANSIAALAGVEAVFVDRMPDDVRGSLTEEESLLVAAWESRQNAPERQRPGEGLAWDAPGFLPPDPPPGNGQH